MVKMPKERDVLLVCEVSCWAGKLRSRGGLKAKAEEEESHHAAVDKEICN